eukprot:gene1565-2074_t
MSTTPSKRLSKEMRREQMLETARRIVREEGTDLLTLGPAQLEAIATGLYVEMLEAGYS